MLKFIDCIYYNYYKFQLRVGNYDVASFFTALFFTYILSLYYILTYLLVTLSFKFKFKTHLAIIIHILIVFLLFFILWYFYEFKKRRLNILKNDEKCKKSFVYIFTFFPLIAIMVILYFLMLHNQGKI